MILRLRSGQVRRVRGAIALAVLLAALPAAAQDTPEKPQVEPDRPDVTNGTHIVGTNLVQVEMGGVFTRTDARQRQFGSPITARWGATPWLELRFGSDGVLTQTDGLTRLVGAGNTQVGAKLQLWADEGGMPVVSILPTVNLPSPSASRGLGSSQPDYTVALLTGRDLTRHAHIDVNYGVGSIGGNDADPRFAQHLVSASLSDAISDNWNPYVEAFWFSRQEADGPHVAALDAGAIYELGMRYALDGGLQFGIAGGHTFAAFAGLTVVFGDISGSTVRARQRQAQRRSAKRSRGR